jgi:hypothetical protein
MAIERGPVADEPLPQANEKEPVAVPEVVLEPLTSQTSCAAAGELISPIASASADAVQRILVRVMG